MLPCGALQRSRVTPACTVAVRFAGEISTIRSSRVRSRLIPPWTGITWPSRLVPTPNGVTAIPCESATTSTCATSATEVG